MRKFKFPIKSHRPYIFILKTLKLKIFQPDAEVSEGYNLAEVPCFEVITAILYKMSIFRRPRQHLCAYHDGARQIMPSVPGFTPTVYPSPASSIAMPTSSLDNMPCRLDLTLVHTSTQCVLVDLDNQSSACSSSVVDDPTLGRRV